MKSTWWKSVSIRTVKWRDVERCLLRNWEPDWTIFANYKYEYPFYVSKNFHQTLLYQFYDCEKKPWFFSEYMWIKLVIGEHEEWFTLSMRTWNPCDVPLHIKVSVGNTLSYNWQEFFISACVHENHVTSILYNTASDFKLPFVKSIANMLYGKISVVILIICGFF